jgi:hypothetical protein
MYNFIIIISKIPFLHFLRSRSARKADNSITLASWEQLGGALAG